MNSDFEVRAARLLDGRRELLEILRQRRAAGSAASAPAPRPPGLDRLPLSVAQEQLWFLDQLAPGQPTYNLVQEARLVGALDVAALRRSLDDLVVRHEALRTVLAADDGKPYQVVLPAAPATLVVDDVSTLPAVERDAAAARLIREQEVNRPFDLAHGPLFRARLVRLADDRHLFTLALHHSVGDGWSLGLIFREYAELYASHRAGRRPNLAPSRLQYADFAWWQRRHLDGPAMADHLAYWERQLVGLSTFELPADRPRPPVPTYRGATAEHTLAPGVRDTVRALSKETGASTFMILSAAFSALLARYTEADEVVIGTGVTGRSRPELEDVVGFFANMVVLRVDTSGDPTFATLVERAREVCLGAWEHQDAPFEQVVERLAPPRDPSRNPLFQVAFQLLDSSTFGGPVLRGVAVEPVDDVRSDRSRFDLTISVIEHSDRFMIMTEFSTDLFDEARVGRLHRHLERLLHAGALAPRMPLSRLPVLSDEEQRHVFALGRGPVTEVRRAPLHVLVAEQAGKRSDAVALRCDGATMTYAELHERVRAVAYRLRALGVGKGEIVGSAAVRGFDEVGTLLGTLTAGAVYAPLDPVSPPRRLARLLSGADVRVLVTRSELAGGLPEPDGWTPLLLDEQTAVPPAAPSWDEWADADSLAYVLHTSGTTGTPKGAGIDHGAMANFLAWMAGAWTLRPGERVLHCCSPTFDLSAAEILVALTSGATLVIATTDDVLSPGALGDLVRREEITHLFVTPTILGLIEPGDYPELREVMVAGEVCPNELMRSWRAPGRRFRNAYGPTEITVACSTFDCTDWSQPSPLPIGHPLPNRWIYVLDRWGNPTPVGVPGQIVVGGAGVSCGYVNDSDLTQRKFVPDRFAPPGRAYLTGDVGYWTDGGTLEFVGRADNQVKLRGLRIELGEIETALARHPGVASAVAAVQVDGVGSERLVAYLVAATEAVPTVAELREFLRAEVPPYMVPGTYTFLIAFPITSHGKVDRRALPTVEADRRDADAEYVPPRTTQERTVAAVFASVLDVERVGAGDAFFVLGGHSLQAAHVLTRLAAAGVNISMKDFYAEPTVEAVARRMSRAGNPGAGRSPLMTLKADGARPRLFCPHAVSGSPYWYLGLSRAVHPDQPMDGFEAPGLHGEEDPIEDLATLAARYVAAVRERYPDGPYLLAGWSMGGFLAFEMARQLAATGIEPPLVAMIDSAVPGPFPAPDERTVMQTFAADLAGLVGREPPQVPATIAGLDAGARLGRLAELLVSAGLVPSDVPPGFIRHRYAVFRANMLAIYGYQPAAYSGRVVMLQAEQEASRAGWRRYAAGAYTHLVVPGTHYTMWAPENLPALARSLDRCVSELE